MNFTKIISPQYLFSLLAFCLLTSNAIAQDRKGSDSEYPLFTPEDARNGICHARSLTQSVYDTIPEKVLLSSQSSKISIIEPKFDTIEEVIQIHPEYRTFTIIPAVYDTIRKEVTTYDSYQYYAFEEDAGVYGEECFNTLTEKVVVGPAESKWRIERKEDCKSKVWDDCVFLVLKNEPEQVHVEKIRVNDCPPPTPVTKTVEANTEIITQVVLRTPAQVKETIVPAKTTTVKRIVVVEYASTSLEEIPSEFKTIKKLIINTPGGKTEFVPVVCAEEVEKLLPKIQEKLKDKGYLKGKIDGKLSARVKDAMLAFQLEHGLPIGQFDYLTMRKLGVKTKKG